MTAHGIITLYTDLNSHPDDSGLASLVLEIGQYRIESRAMNALEAARALRTITRAFSDAIKEGDPGYGDIM